MGGRRTRTRRKILRMNVDPLKLKPILGEAPRRRRRASSLA
jgi:hypothetical protein